MVSQIRSLGIKGIGGYEVSVECFISPGLPGFEIVGLPDAAVREARDRVRAAVKTCGRRFPASRVTVNLAPADTKKAGTVYDLPVLLGILAAFGEIERVEIHVAMAFAASVQPFTIMTPVVMTAVTRNGREVRQLCIKSEKVIVISALTALTIASFLIVT